MKITLLILTCLLSLVVMTRCYQNKSEPEAPPPPPAEVKIFLNQNYSTASGMEWVNLKTIGNDYYSGYMKESNLQVVLPGGRNLNYLVYNGSANQKERIVRSVSFRLMETTPSLELAVERLKTEISNVAPEGLQKCEDGLLKIRNLHPDASKTFGGDIAACDFEIEKGVQFRPSINSILVSRNGGLASEWTIVLDFYLKDAYKTYCCKEPAPNR
jgi:hypothetical protein